MINNLKIQQSRQTSLAWFCVVLHSFFFLNFLQTTLFIFYFHTRRQEMRKKKSNLIRPHWTTNKHVLATLVVMASTWPIFRLLWRKFIFFSPCSDFFFLQFYAFVCFTAFSIRPCEITFCWIYHFFLGIFTVFYCYLTVCHWVEQVMRGSLGSDWTYSFYVYDAGFSRFFERISLEEIGNA